MFTVLLLIASNVFMTFAWYGHLKYTDKPLFAVIVASWLIAFFEYCLQVPANRIGFKLEGYSTYQLKIIQEVISLSVFVIFARSYMKELPRWNHLVSFVLIIAAVYFAVLPNKPAAPDTPSAPSIGAKVG